MIDIHSHILFSVDDGSQSLEESVKMAAMAESDGISDVVSTPHVFRGFFNHEDHNIYKSRLRELNEALEKKGINLKVYRGAEVHVSHNLLDEVENNRDALVINHGSYMLIEFPGEHIFSGVKNLFFDLLNLGIRPIIAHPERNYIFKKKHELLFDLIRMGSLCQVNGGSFTGIYGSRVKETVLNFLKFKFIHFVASDSHNQRSLSPRLSDAFETVASLVGEDEAENYFVHNPRAVIDDKDLPYLPQPVDPREKRRSLKIKVPGILKWK
jgi:protein-tyrosine phosphatase